MREGKTSMLGRACAAGLAATALAGSGVPRGRLDLGRTADLAPTLLALLGREAPEGLDGANLLAGQTPAKLPPVEAEVP